MLYELLGHMLLLAVIAVVGLGGWSVYRQARRQDAAAADDGRRGDEWHRLAMRRGELLCERMRVETDRLNRLPLPAGGE